MEEDHRDLEEEEDEEDEDNDLFDEDMDALRRACMISGSNPVAAAGDSNSDGDKPGIAGVDEEEDDDYDLELVRSIRSRFAIPSSESHLPQPLCFLPPPEGFSDDDDVEDDEDFETLRAIQKRFAAYGNDTMKNSLESPLEDQEQGHALPVLLEDKASNALCIHRVDACDEFIDTEYTTRMSHQSGDNLQEQPSASIQWKPAAGPRPFTSQPNCSNFPKSGKVFMDAIKKNRSYQKFLRSKLIQIEAKIEQNKKLKERVKILKDFQVTCRKRTGRALSQKKDARVQLISMKKSWLSKDLKVSDKKIPAMYCGPQENSHVANYRMALSKFPLSIDRKKWSLLERKNLEKGIHQQFQETVFQNMVARMSDSGDSSEDFGDLDNLLASVKNLSITPETIRTFLPKVNWNQVVSLYVAGRTGVECETRWLNFEDPLINNDSWTAQEDKSLLLIVQNKGISNWLDISVSLGTNRTPFQCLARYQRSLNVSILKREWTKDDDAKLRFAVEVFGECDWQAVASSLEGWTGTQCSNRWKKSLHPTREKVGRWTDDEDKRLAVAQMLFGPKNWKKTAQFVPGRTEVQCRERWVNSLDPSLNWEKWTLEEDLNLRKAIEEHGYCWAKVAAALPRRTDNMCRRRWKRLLPDEVPLLQAAKRMQKAVLICNFVDRESERPAICPKDFHPLSMITADENVNHSKEQSKKSRRKIPAREKIKPSCEPTKKRRVRKSKEHTQTGLENAQDMTNNHAELDGIERQEATTDQSPERQSQKRKRRSRKPSIKKKELDELEERERDELQTESLDLASNGDGTGSSFVEKSTSLAKKKRVSLKRKDSGSLVETSCPPLAKKRRVSKKQKDSTKTKTHSTESEKPQNISLSSGKSATGAEPQLEVPSCVSSTVTLETNSEENGSLGGKIILARKKTSNTKRPRKSKKDNSSVVVSRDISSVTFPNNGQNMDCFPSNPLDHENDQTCQPSVQNESELFQIQENMIDKELSCERMGQTMEPARFDEESGHETNGISTALYVEKESEKDRQNSELLSEKVNKLDEVSQMTDGSELEKEPRGYDNDMTLACFLQNRLKKKRLQLKNIHGC